MASVAVRLEGGLGDHILGMRVLYFVRHRCPRHKIKVYSDAAGHPVQLEIAGMSPFVSQVTPIYQKKGLSIPVSAMGKLQYVDEEYLSLMQSAEVFIDTQGESLLTDASRVLDVPFFEILARPPEIVITSHASRRAQDFIKRYSNAAFVGVNLAKSAALMRERAGLLRSFLLRLLRNPRVVVLNFFTSEYEFSHWPEPARSLRNSDAHEGARFMRELCAIHERIEPCVDLPLAVVAALLKRCRYFIGVDNGIKHLAWALRVPLTFFHPGTPDMRCVLRWMPDFNRMLTFSCSDAEVRRHVAMARDAIDTEKT